MRHVANMFGLCTRLLSCGQSQSCFNSLSLCAWVLKSWQTTGQKLIKLGGIVCY